MENSYEDIEEAMKSNVIAPIYLTSFLSKNGVFIDRARVLNIGSKCGHIHFPGYSTYCVTKAALYMSTLAMKNDFKKNGKTQYN
jgi:short-subunit dehydrogenase